MNYRQTHFHKKLSAEDIGKAIEQLIQANLIAATGEVLAHTL
jgi:hypothetical protein